MEYVKEVYPYLFSDTTYPDTRPFFQRAFMALKVDGCNATGGWSFSDAFIDVSSGSSGLSEVFVFRGAVQTILKSRACHNILTGEQREALDLLGFYLQNECHKKCLKALLKKKPQDRKESEIQAVLALHLFGPLAGKSELLADQKCDGKCSTCGKQVNKGDTSFGNNKVWHGHADIAIKHSKIKVKKHIPDDIDKDKLDEPSHKKARTDSDGNASDECESDASCDSVDTDYGDHYMPLGPYKLQKGMHSKDLSQILAQTIVNSFIQNKRNRDLNEYFIPCFLASENNITIHMYNPLYDILLTQGDCMPIFSDGELDIDTVFTVWMTLNFNKFPAGMVGENIRETWQKYCEESSGFQNVISSCLDIYKNEMEEPIVHEDYTVYKSNHRSTDVIIFVKELWEKEVKT